MDRLERDIVIIGSGPAGTSAARVLIDAGLHVTLLEAGQKVKRTVFPADDWMTFRNHASRQHEAYYGAAINAARDGATRSPKFSVDWFADLLDRSAQMLDYQATDFAGAPVAAVGGLSVAWGAGVSLFNEMDVEGWPISLGDLIPHYLSVASRIGLSGEWPASIEMPENPVQPHPGLHPVAEYLLRGSQKRDPQQMKLAVALQAVISSGMAGRQGCDLSGFCLHGCSRGSIWSADIEVEALCKSANFELRTGAFVSAVSSMPDGRWLLRVTGAGGELQEIAARRVISAAGAIGSARLVDQALGLNARRRLLSTPTAAFAVVVPAHFGRGWSERVYGLSQLSLDLSLKSDAGSAFGYLFSAERLPISALESASPFGFRGTWEVFREIAPATLLGNLFFDSRHSDHWIETRGGTVHVTGGFAPSLETAHAQVGPALRRAFFRLGGVVAPIRPAIASPGSDLHYAGTVPMGKNPAIGECGRDGAVAGAENFFVVDGSALPTLPPKSHTFTIMANAARIAAGSLM